MVLDILRDSTALLCQSMMAAIYHATGNLDVGDVGTPDMISMANIKPSELIGVLLVFFDWYSSVDLLDC